MENVGLIAQICGHQSLELPGDNTITRSPLETILVHINNS